MTGITLRALDKSLFGRYYYFPDFTDEQIKTQYSSLEPGLQCCHGFKKDIRKIIWSTFIMLLLCAGH